MTAAVAAPPVRRLVPATTALIAVGLALFLGAGGGIGMARAVRPEPDQNAVQIWRRGFQSGYEAARKYDGSKAPPLEDEFVPLPSPFAPTDPRMPK